MRNAASVKDRLKNRSRKTGRSLQELYTVYGLERTIYRISISKYADNFILTVIAMNLDDPVDAYELSFVAVPAQRTAGVTKAAGDPDVDEAFDTLLSCPDLSEHRKFGELLKHMQQSTMQAVDREERKKILEENDKIIKIFEKEN